MKSETRLTTKGQVVIPKAIRARLDWKPGTRLVVEAKDDSVVMRAETGELSVDVILDQLAGTFDGYDGDPLAELEADHRMEIERDERWLRRHR